MIDETTVLLVPMRIDALVLHSPRSVASSSVDFSRAPHQGEFADRNSGVPFLSEELLSHPFDVAPAASFGDGHAILGTGVHLHWALPDALHTASVRTRVFEGRLNDGDISQLAELEIPKPLFRELSSRGFKPEHFRLQATESADIWRLLDRLTGSTYEIRVSSERPASVRIWRLETRFPPVPTRWLVTRRTGGAIDGQWVVESDYLARDMQGDGVSYPHPDLPFQPGRLGRTQPRTEWTPSSGGPRLPELTAIGFGDPNFATLYPNCWSVFGFHDIDSISRAGHQPLDVSYDVIGWWPEAKHEPQSQPRFQQAMQRHASAGQGQGGSRDHEIWQESFREAFGWHFPDAEADYQRGRTVCFGRVQVACTKEEAEDRWGAEGAHGRVTVSVGTTGTEAMSAYLADKPREDRATKEGEEAAEAALKASTEESLEAIHLVDQLRDAAADVHSSFREARHEQGFTAVDGGVLWSVSDPAEKAEPATGDAASVLDIPDLGALLDRLNQAQARLDALKDGVEAGRRLLFSEWSKYLATAHATPDEIGSGPDHNLIRAYIEAGLLRELTTDDGAVARAAEAEQTRDAALFDLRRAVGNMHQDARIEARPAARYWRPNEPVILVAGDAAMNTPRHGEDGALPCALDRIASASIEDGLDDLVEIVRRRFDGVKPGAPGFVHCCDPPWNPILLEWEVGFASNIDAARDRRGKGGAYPKDAVSSMYSVSPHSPDLELDDIDSLPAAAPTPSYSGRSILTAHATLQLRRRLQAMIVEILLPEYQRDPENADVDLGPDTDTELFGRLTLWQARRGIATAPPTARFLLEQYNTYYGPEAAEPPRVLSQALSGFNDALLMQRQTIQLPVDDPIGFSDARDFAKTIRDAVNGRNEVAPQPWRPFHPIRAGMLEIRRLQLVDSFGRIQPLDIDRVCRAETLALGEAGKSAPSLIHLRPRLVQPARLSFRLLAPKTDVGRGDIDSNAAKDLSPVLGWIALNRLDGDLSLYAPDGRALGWLEETGEAARPVAWSSAPGAEGLAVGQLPHPLSELAERWTGADGLAMFRNLETHIDAIQPASTGPTPGALLAGRPLALIRARIGLELKGPPAQDQSYEALELAMARWREAGGTPDAPSSDAFPSVGFPVRLGAFGRLEDGVAAWWPEERDPSGRVRLGAARFASDEDVITLSLAEGARSVVMLVDPRTPIHLTSGLLPTKAISIPNEHYAPALERLALWFRAGPILSPASHVTAPLPRSPGFEWSWVETLGGTRVETEAPAAPRREAHWDNQLELIEGWLRLTPAAREETE